MQFPTLVEEIILLRPSTIGAEDSYSRLLDKSGTYTSKSGYLSQRLHTTALPANYTVPTNFNWNKMIWKAQLLQKIQLFLWKVMQNAVPTSENLQKKGLLENTNCIRCGERETTIHLFFHCHFAQRVWELAPWSSPANLTQALSFGEKLVASYQCINLPPVGTNINLFPWIVWNLRIVRNQLLFENMTFSLQDCLSKSVITAREWTTAQDAQPKITPLPNHATASLAISPTTLVPTTIICNTDAAWR